MADADQSLTIVEDAEPSSSSSSSVEASEEEVDEEKSPPKVKRTDNEPVECNTSVSD